jgi:hypothetical protein
MKVLLSCGSLADFKGICCREFLRRSLGLARLRRRMILVLGGGYPGRHAVGAFALGWYWSGLQPFPGSFVGEVQAVRDEVGELKAHGGPDNLRGGFRPSRSGLGDFRWRFPAMNCRAIVGRPVRDFSGGLMRRGGFEGVQTRIYAECERI